MKKTILILLLCGGWVRSQTIVINEKLLIQMTKNHAVRLASEETFLNSYEKQKKLYEDVNHKVTQVIAIQEYIYQQLRNINSAILQGKKLVYIYQYLDRIVDNSKLMIDQTSRKPQYAIFVNKYYRAILQQMRLLTTELVQEVLNEDKDFLMDSMDRDILIEKIYMRLRHINGNVIYITLRLQNAPRIPYVYQIPVLNNYISVDKLIIEDIIKKYKYL